MAIEIETKRFLEVRDTTGSAEPTIGMEATEAVPEKLSPAQEREVTSTPIAVDGFDPSVKKSARAAIPFDKLDVNDIAEDKFGVVTVKGTVKVDGHDKHATVTAQRLFQTLGAGMVAESPPALIQVKLHAMPVSSLLAPELESLLGRVETNIRVLDESNIVTARKTADLTAYNRLQDLLGSLINYGNDRFITGATPGQSGPDGFSTITTDRSKMPGQSGPDGFSTITTPRDGAFVAPTTASFSLKGLVDADLATPSLNKRLGFEKPKVRLSEIGEVERGPDNTVTVYQTRKGTLYAARTGIVGIPEWFKLSSKIPTNRGAL